MRPALIPFMLSFAMATGVLAADETTTREDVALFLYPDFTTLERLIKNAQYPTAADKQAALTKLAVEKKDALEHFRKFYPTGLDEKYRPMLSNQKHVEQECTLFEDRVGSKTGVLALFAGTLVNLIVGLINEKLDKEIKNLSKSYDASETAHFYLFDRIGHGARHTGRISALDKHLHLRWSCFRLVRLKTTFPAATSNEAPTGNLELEFVGQFKLTDDRTALQVRPLRLHVLHPKPETTDTKIAFSAALNLTSVIFERRKGQKIEVVSESVMKKKIGKSATEGVDYWKPEPLYFWNTIEGSTRKEIGKFLSWKSRPRLALPPHPVLTQQLKAKSCTGGELAANEGRTYRGTYLPLGCTTVKTTFAEVAKGRRNKTLRAMKRVFAAMEKDLKKTLTSALTELLEPADPEVPDDTETPPTTTDGSDPI